MGKFCVHCGAAMSDNALFCTVCGVRQDSFTTQSAPNGQPIVYQQPVYNVQSSLVSPTAKNKKVGIVIAVCVAVLIVAIVGICLIVGNGSGDDLPFRGVKRGDSVEEVEKILGEPNDFDDNGMNNFHYYYENVEFLDMKGYVDIHFKLSKVDTLGYYCNTGTMNKYDSAVEYYTEKYGEPISNDSDYSDYFSETECSSWKLDDGSVLRIEYHSAAGYEKPVVSIKIYR